MTRYTTVSVNSAAQEELAELWMPSPDRNAVTAAVHSIDKELAADAEKNGVELSEGLRTFFSPPIRRLYAVNEADRIVEILRVKRI